MAKPIMTREEAIDIADQWLKSRSADAEIYRNWGECYESGYKQFKEPIWLVRAKMFDSRFGGHTDMNIAVSMRERVVRIPVIS